MHFGDGPAFVGYAIPARSPVKRLAPKIGGSPVGMPESLWPKCAECGRHMDFIAQWGLKEPARLSGRYDFAYAFVCHGYIDEVEGHQCKTWDPHSGASRLVLVEKPMRRDRPPYLGVMIWDEFRVRFGRNSASRRRPALVPPELPGNGLSIRDWVGNIIARKRLGIERPTVHDGIGVGGNAEWVYDEPELNCPRCGGAMKFVGQIQSQLIPWSDHPGFPEGVHLPFGDCGSAYAFMCGQECSADSTYLMWQ